MKNKKIYERNSVKKDSLGIVYSADLWADLNMPRGRSVGWLWRSASTRSAMACVMIAL